MSTEAVDEIGQGRVWTGYDAKSIGLIDTYGGIEKAIEIAKSLAEIKDYRIISLPKSKDPFSEFAKELKAEISTSNLIMRKIGFQSPLSDPIEEIIKADKIQARIPFMMKLK